jgi:MOSC domain-containing protein YiiM
MRGTVLQVSISQGGVPKVAVPEAAVTSRGLEGDRCAHPQFHGGPLQALLLIASEAVDDLAARGWLGENITTVGLDRRSVRPGQRYRVGTAIVEITRLRVPCATLDAYGRGIQGELYDSACKAGDARSPRWGVGGFYAAVVEPGWVRVGDAIELLESAA